MGNTLFPNSRIRGERNSGIANNKNTGNMDHIDFRGCGSLSDEEAKYMNKNFKKAYDYAVNEFRVLNKRFNGCLNLECEEELTVPTIEGLMDSVKNYKPGHGGSLATYARKSIKLHVIEMVRERYPFVDCVDNGCERITIISIDKPMADGRTYSDILLAEDEEDRENETRRLEEISEKVDRLLQKLNRKERLCVEMSLRNNDEKEAVKEIAESLKLTNRRVREILKVARVKMEMLSV